MRGPVDSVDVFAAPDDETARRVSLIARAYGQGWTKTWPATTWGRFKELIREVS